GTDAAGATATTARPGRARPRARCRPPKAATPIAGPSERRAGVNAFALGLRRTATAGDPDVEAFLGEVDAHLRPHFDRALVRLADVAPLKRGVIHQVTSGGKRIRAALCVATCELFGTPYAHGLDFAAAIEHIHNFTLVHDDIADGDTVRRARPSIWKQHGIAHAINIGDVFVPLAARAILDAGYPDALKLRLLGLTTEHALDMVEGQNLDLALRTRNDAGYEDYVACTAKKTGAFLSLATVGGGMIGGAAEGQLERLREFGRLGGISFQIRDDLLDMDGGKGRPPGSDVLEGKRTLLVVHAAHQATAADRRRLYAILNRPRVEKTAADVAWVWRLFRRTRADEYAEETAARFIDQACDQVLALPETAAKYRVLRLARYLSARRH
ncbi:MAG TPA: polyprenyl synthetase family protein, partial [Candidatus Tectomicrobia bacterium]|nr:polyprenyl synthetase family protein [Candidatus Tectomicrobia bacterium]